jgi:hypothetical protein
VLIITTPIKVNRIQPIQIYDWIANLTQEKYQQWDPVAHTGIIKRPVVLNEGDCIYFEEFVEGYKINFEWKIIILDKPNRIRMKANIPYPVYLNLSFLSSKDFKGTEVIHQLEIGFNYFRLETIIDLFVGKFIMHDKKIAAIKKHAVNEFTNLEKILL